MKKYFTKRFYTYHFFHIKRKKPFDYIFIDWTTFLSLLTIFVLGVLFLYPYKLEFIMPTPESQVSLLESILRTVGILFGISFSFIILSFNIFFRYFGRYAFLDFFKSKSAKICITLLFTTVLFLSYSIYFIKETESVISYTIFLFFTSIILSIISFFSIFPCFINLLRNSQNRKHIIRLFEKLNEEWTINKFLAKAENELPSFYQQDPINILNEIGLMSIKESDNYNIELITDNMITFYRDNIYNKSQNKHYISEKELYYKFNELLENFFFSAIKEKNENIARTNIYTLFQIENIVVENIGKDGFEFILGFGDKYRYFDLNYTVEKFFKKALQSGEEDICCEILQNYNTAVNSAIETLFPKDVNYNSKNRFEVIEQCEIIFEPLKKLIDFSDLLASSKKDHLFKEVFNTFYTIEQKVLSLETTDSTKCLIFNVIHNYKSDCFQKYIEMNETRYISYLNFPFKEGAYIYEKTKCKTPYLGFLEIFDLIFSKNKLNNVVINLAKAEMLNLIRTNGEELLVKGVERFVQLGHKITESDNEYKKDVYLKLYENLLIVQKEAIAKPSSKEIITLINHSIDTFTMATKFRDELKKTGFVTDIRIT